MLYNINSPKQNEFIEMPDCMDDLDEFLMSELSPSTSQYCIRNAKNACDTYPELDESRFQIEQEDCENDPLLNNDLETFQLPNLSHCLSAQLAQQQPIFMFPDDELFLPVTSSESSDGNPDNQVSDNIEYNNALYTGSTQMSYCLPSIASSPSSSYASSDSLSTSSSNSSPLSSPESPPPSCSLVDELFAEMNFDPKTSPTDDQDTWVASELLNQQLSPSSTGSSSIEEDLNEEDIDAQVYIYGNIIHNYDIIIISYLIICYKHIFIL